MLNEYYDVIIVVYVVGYESYFILVGNICGCLESYLREIVCFFCLVKVGDLSFVVGFNIKLNDCDINVFSNVVVVFLGIIVISNDDMLVL